MRRATRLLLPVSLVSLMLALVNAAPLDAAPARTAAGKGQKRHPLTKKHHTFLEPRVAAVKNNLPNVLSLGALVVDLDSGQELFNRKGDQPRAIASISKLTAALVIMDRGLELEGLTTMKKIDTEVAKGGAPSRLPEGMTLSNRDLLHAALLGSDNRAIAALGRTVGLNATQFAEAMNKKAAQLGLKHTHFREPTGLSPENVSTPRETIAMLRAAMAHPTLGPVVRRVEYDAHPVARGPIHYINTHRPAHRSNTDVLGGKTGFNDQARYCLVLAARVDGHTYGMAFLGTEGKLTRFGDAARVSDWLVVHKPRPTSSAWPMLAKYADPRPPAPPPIEPPPLDDNGLPGSANPDAGVTAALAGSAVMVTRP